MKQGDLGKGWGRGDGQWVGPRPQGPFSGSEETAMHAALAPADILKVGPARTRVRPS